MDQNNKPLSKTIVFINHARQRLKERDTDEEKVYAKLSGLVSPNRLEGDLFYID